MTLRNRALALSCAVCLALLAGCGTEPSGRRVSPGERFKLEKDEKVSVNGADLAIQLKGVRRSWRTDGRSETVDADIAITFGGRERRQWVEVGGKVEAGGYSVELAGANPFGKSSAELVVKGS